MIQRFNLNDLYQEKTKFGDIGDNLKESACLFLTIITKITQTYGKYKNEIGVMMLRDGSIITGIGGPTSVYMNTSEAILSFHTHPSGNPRFSFADLRNGLTTGISKKYIGTEKGLYMLDFTLMPEYMKDKFRKNRYFEKSMDDYIHEIRDWMDRNTIFIGDV